MAIFEVKIQPIFVRPHPNADRLDLGNIGSPDGWQVVVAKGRFKTGDLVAYIGENALVPEWVLKKYGYWDEIKNKGMLAGTGGNRVKAIKLRDEFSLGICIPVNLVPEPPTGYLLEGREVFAGDNVSEILGVTKYEPPIPISMAGDVYNGGTHIGVNYDIEDLKNFPDVFIEGEDVQVTVKIHGTLCQLVFMRTDIDGLKHDDHAIVNTDKHVGFIAVGSKGLGAKGLFLKYNEKNANNVYLRATVGHWPTVVSYFMNHPIKYDTASVIGEVFGDGVQDLNYGLKNTIGFRVFDVYVDYRGRGRYLNDSELDIFCDDTGLTRVPVIYRGKYDKELIIRLANDPETEFPGANHVREGVVIKPAIERTDPSLGRVVLKTRSVAYMTRKGGTEYN